MNKSKSAFTFNDFMKKCDEVRDFGNDYGQFVVIDKEKRTITLLPLKKEKLVAIIEEEEHQVDVEVGEVSIHKRKRPQDFDNQVVIVTKDDIITRMKEEEEDEIKKMRRREEDKMLSFGLLSAFFLSVFFFVM
jgi:hypothetical protein